jgi:hypothetical protein
MGDGVKKQTDRRRTEAKVLPAREALSLISTGPPDAAGYANTAGRGGSNDSVKRDGRRIQVSDRERLLGDLTAFWARRRRIA